MQMTRLAPAACFPCLLSFLFFRGNLKENCHVIEKRFQSLHLITTKGKPLNQRSVMGFFFFLNLKPALNTMRYTHQR